MPAFDLRSPLTLNNLDGVLGQPLQVDLSPADLAALAAGRAWVDGLTADDTPVYGINTGFGHLKNKRVARDQLDQLQHNLLVSHAVGVGPSTPPQIVRWMLLFKTHMLLRGHSGVRPELVSRLVTWLQHDWLPVVPNRGSLGASGDLAPLAHLCLPLIGRGYLQEGDDGRKKHPAEALQRQHNLEPIALQAKEGLALINGTQFMAAYAANICVRAGRLLDMADLILCMTLEGLQGSTRPMDPRLHELRPHPGAQQVAANVRRHMQGSEILAAHANCDKVQDPYSLRCAPPVHGAVRDAWRHACDTVEREMNSVTDNPILFGPPDHVEAEAISGGNFHGASLALTLDYLAIALCDLGSISERRVYLLLEGLDGLPKLLMQDTGVNSGFMLPQYTAAALLNECKVLSSPASVDTIPTSLGQEDHVSMGATAAVKGYEVLDRVETILAIELMCAAQALDYRAPMKPGAGPQAAHEIVREHITHADVDREFGQDIQASVDLLRNHEGLRGVARLTS